MSWEEGVAPEGWKLGKLGDVAMVVGGGTPKTGLPGNFSESEGHPWITPADLTGYTDKFVSRGRRFLTDQGLATSSAKYMPVGSVLFSTRAPIGYVAVAANPVTTNQGFRSFVPNGTVDSEYIYYALKFLRPLAEQMASGTTFTELSGSNAAKLPIAYPSLCEQRAIVRALDVATEKGRTATSHLIAARRAIDRFRQAVLAAAYVEAGTAERNGDGTRLEEILSEPFKNGYSARPVGHETPYRILMLTATTSGWFNKAHFKYTDEEFSPTSPFWLSPGDIIIQRGNTAEYVGVPALYEGPPGEFLYPDLMIRARVRGEISPRFVWYMLLAPQARNFLRDRATGSAGNMPKINQKVLADVPVPIPRKDVRDGMVEKLDMAFALADVVDQRLQVVSRRLDRSSQAVLAKAFRGELITNGLPG